MKTKRVLLFSSLTLFLLLFFPLQTSATEPPTDWSYEGGATRPVDFWMTHADYVHHILTAHSEGSVALGWLTLTGMPEVLGLFWANPSWDTTGLTRDVLCKKRLYTSQEAVGAYLNSLLSNGEPLPLSWEEISAILSGEDEQAIAQLGNLLADFNGTGAGVAIVDTDGYAVLPSDRWGSQEAADLAAANCYPTFQPPIPPQKPPKLR